MNITINEKDYELKFGLKFINQLDKIYTQELSGIKFGMGVEMMNTYLNMKHPQALANIIKAGTSHLSSKPSNKEIEDYLEEQAVNDKLEDLFTDFLDAVNQAPFLKHKLKMIEGVQK